MNHLTVQQLSAALDGALGGPSLELAVHHLAHCHECRDRQSRLARNDDALRRLLALDPHDYFLDDLERRVEAVLVAVMRGLPVPPMVTASPLQSEEDPGEPAEPPLPERPELGRAGAIAQEAGFGRIGLKPTASTQAPRSDPAEALRLLEALERGDAGDFTELTAQGGTESTGVDGPVFDLPGWIKQGGGSKPPGESRPREVQKVHLFFEHLDDRSANLPHEAVDEVFRLESPGPASPAPPPAVVPETPIPPSHERFAPPRLPVRTEQAPAASASHNTGGPPRLPTPPTATPAQALPPTPPPNALASPPPAARANEPMIGPPPLPHAIRAAALAGAPLPAPAAPRVAPPPVAPPPAEPALSSEMFDIVRQEPPRRYEPATPPPSAPAPSSEMFDIIRREPPRRYEPAAANVSPEDSMPRARPHVRPVIKARESQIAGPHRRVPNVSPTPRFAGARMLATVTVGALLVLMLALQFLPRGESTAESDSRDLRPAVRSATTPLPVDSPVRPGGSLADSAGAVPDSLAAGTDTLRAAPGR